MVKHEVDYIYTRPSKFKIFSDRFMPLFIFVSSMVLYVKTMAPSIYWGKSAALATSNFILGLPEAPTYPIYTMIGRLFALIPGLTPAFAANLLSVVFAAASVTVFYQTIKYLLDIPLFHPDAYKKILQQHQINARQKVANPGSAHRIDLNLLNRPDYNIIPNFAVTSLFALTLPIWLSAVRAEVFSLQLLLTLLAVMFALKGLREEEQKYNFIAVWFYALTFANHPFLSLALVPAFLFFVIYSIAKAENKLGTALLFSFFFLISMSIYSYIPFRAAFDPSINMSHPDSTSSFWATTFDSMRLTDLGVLFSSGEYLIRLKKVALFVSSEIGWPIIGLMILGFWGYSRLSKKYLVFMPLAILGSLFMVLWIADFSLRTGHPADYFSVLIALILMVSVAGLTAILKLWLRADKASVFTAAMVLVFSATAAYDNYEKVNLSDANGPEIVGREILESLPNNSILLVDDYDLLMPLWYLAYADSVAHNVSILAPSAMTVKSYRDQLKTNCPDLVFPKDFADNDNYEPKEITKKLIDLNSDKEIFLQLGVPGIDYPQIAPAGLLYIYVGKDSKVKPKWASYKTHIELAERILKGNEQEIHTVNFAGWWMFDNGKYYRHIGNKKIAMELFARAMRIDRDNIEMRLELAQMLADKGEYKEALKYVQRALDIDSRDKESLMLGQRLLNELKEKEAVAIH